MGEEAGRKGPEQIALFKCGILPKIDSIKGGGDEAEVRLRIPKDQLEKHIPNLDKRLWDFLHDLPGVPLVCAIGILDPATPNVTPVIQEAKALMRLADIEELEDAATD